MSIDAASSSVGRSTLVLVSKRELSFGSLRAFAVKRPLALLVRAGNPADRSRPFSLRAPILPIVARRVFALGGCPRPQCPRSLCQWLKADIRTTDVYVLGILDRHGAKITQFVPIVLGTVNLWLAFKRSDAIDEESQVPGLCSALLNRPLHQRHRVAHKSGIENGVLQDEPRRFRPVLTDQRATRPTVLRQNDSQSAIVLTVKFGHSVVVPSRQSALLYKLVAQCKISALEGQKLGAEGAVNHVGRREISAA